MTVALTVIVLISLLVTSICLAALQQRKVSSAKIAASLNYNEQSAEDLENDVRELILSAEELFEKRSHLSEDALAMAIVNINNGLYGSAIASFVETLEINKDKVTPESWAKLYPLYSEWRWKKETDFADKESIRDLRASLRKISAENPYLLTHNGQHITILALFEAMWNRFFAKYEPSIEAIVSRFRDELGQKIEDKIQTEKLSSPSKNYESMTPREFEEFVARIFEAMGYSVELTPPSRDYGVDIIARRGSDTIAVQVKRYSPGNNVGSADIQRLIGAMSFKNYRANKGVIVTTSDFTVHAIEQAEENPVELWGRNILDKLADKYIYPPN